MKGEWWNQTAPTTPYSYYSLFLPILCIFLTFLAFLDFLAFFAAPDIFTLFDFLSGLAFITTTADLAVGAAVRTGGRTVATVGGAARGGPTTAAVTEEGATRTELMAAETK